MFGVKKPRVVYLEIWFPQAMASKKHYSKKADTTEAIVRKLNCEQSQWLTHSD